MVSNTLLETLNDVLHRAAQKRNQCQSRANDSREAVAEATAKWEQAQRDETNS
jgi:hypothetical protein